MSVKLVLLTVYLCVLKFLLLKCALHKCVIDSRCFDLCEVAAFEFENVGLVFEYIMRYMIVYKSHQTIIFLQIL